MFLKKILIAIIFSQILYLWVFWLEKNTYYVIEPQKNLCGSFEKGTEKNPNWLQNWWEAVFLKDKLKAKFELNPNCKNWNIANCCKDMGYKYAGVPIGQAYISWERKAAEFLAYRDIIQVRSFNPAEYKLEKNISRKEVMKVIMNTSEKKIQQKCEWIFADVTYDWACKYIEAALKENFISWNEAFRPDDTLTKSEALKLIFKARGIQKRYETNSWQQDYISSAYYLWYIDNKFSDYNTPASRGWIFEVLAKTYSDFSY